MKKKLAFVIFSIFILAIAMTMAAQQNSHSRNNSQNSSYYSNSSNSTNWGHNSSRINYGLCIANATKVKNECFKQSQQDYRNCLQIIRNNTNHTDINRTLMRNQRADCRTIYRQELNLCKTQFKENKLACNQYRCINNSNNCLNRQQ